MLNNLITFPGSCLFYIIMVGGAGLLDWKVPLIPVPCIHRHLFTPIFPQTATSKPNCHFKPSHTTTRPGTLRTPLVRAGRRCQKQGFDFRVMAVSDSEQGRAGKAVWEGERRAEVHWPHSQLTPCPVGREDIFVSCIFHHQTSTGMKNKSTASEMVNNDGLILHAKLKSLCGFQ